MKPIFMERKKYNLRKSKILFVGCRIFTSTSGCLSCSLTYFTLIEDKISWSLTYILLILSEDTIQGMTNHWLKCEQKQRTVDLIPERERYKRYINIGDYVGKDLWEIISKSTRLVNIYVAIILPSFFHPHFPLTFPI